LRVRLRRRAAALTARGSFTPEECREGLRMSLQQLRVDCIDFFLMHDVLPEQITTALLETLGDAVRAGWIGRFGVATSAAHAIAIARTMEPGTIAQFPSVFAPTVTGIPNHIVKITHSALAADFLTLYRQLVEDKALRKQWSADLDLDCSDKNQLGRLFLYAAMTENAGGTVLFSSLNEERILLNAALMRECPFSSAQVKLLWTLVKEEGWRRPQAS
jgi:Aldo/keto reductase family